MGPHICRAAVVDLVRAVVPRRETSAAGVGRHQEDWHRAAIGWLRRAARHCALPDNKTPATCPALGSAEGRHPHSE
eukprot:2776647-Prymnesium_polylepis.3